MSAVSIVSDDQDVERSLERNLKLTTEVGAAFSNDMVIKCLDGALSVEAPRESVGKPLISLPFDCVLPVDFFQLSVAEDNIIISSHEQGLTNECVTRMEALLELYNLTRKLAWHRRTSPWTLLALYPELFEHVRLQLANDLVTMFSKFATSGDEDALTLASFLHTRAYDYREYENAPPLQVLLPVIEFLNHHLQGAPVQLEDGPDDNGALMTIKRSVSISGNECFAFYGLYDSFDTWMSYGFIDESAPFVRLVPMTIDLPRVGTIRLANFARLRDHAELAQSVIDLHVFIPKVLAKRENSLDIASLLLPGPAMPGALRRTLRFLINELVPGHPQQRQLALQAEQEVVAATRKFYANLTAALQSLALKDVPQSQILFNFLRMCELQLARIDNYGTYAKG